MHPLNESILCIFKNFSGDSDYYQLDTLSTYVELLCRWNKRMNLTGLSTEQEIIDNLIADALFLHSVIPQGKSIIDLGSGSGALAVPLAITDHTRKVHSVDKSLKKIQFQRHVKRSLGLQNLDPIHSRAEDIPSLGSEILVAKAFGSVSLILALGRLHLLNGGLAFLVRGSGEKPSEEEGFAIESSQPYSLEKGQKIYQLLVYKKV
jgi:16S rRNA (guanine527-N7)-methyltransferase